MNRYKSISARERDRVNGETGGVMTSIARGTSGRIGISEKSHADNFKILKFLILKFSLRYLQLNDYLM